MNALLLALALLLPPWPHPVRVVRLGIQGGRQYAMLSQEWSCGVVKIWFVWVDA
jgi:hypothetical protein